MITYLRRIGEKAPVDFFIFNNHSPFSKFSSLFLQALA